MNVIKLDLRQNAMHTLYHAVEHLYWSESDTDAKEGRSFDHDEHMVQWRNDGGHLCFPLSDFTRLPAAFNLKFAALHLIQAAELLLKAYVEHCEPAALFVKAGSLRRSPSFPGASTASKKQIPKLRIYIPSPSSSRSKPLNSTASDTRCGPAHGSADS